MILKIETRQAFDQLPSLLLYAMRHPAPLGVMIARGDLAIECGWERLAEIQEEILRVCEAAHVPCIWATQVLEELAQHGRPTRAEITDAAMGSRAEGIMLNKGPNIAATIRTLHDIVQRMQQHQHKNRSTFRRLELAAHHHSTGC
jgi:pyruvate kinase